MVLKPVLLSSVNEFKPLRHFWRSLLIITELKLPTLDVFAVTEQTYLNSLKNKLQRQGWTFC